jgi:hypothetical protein
MLPRCLRQNEMQKLESYLKQLLKQVQNLPERTASEATYLMMGCIPVNGELHKRLLKTFGNIIRKDNSIEKDIALRQLFVFCIFHHLIDIVFIYCSANRSIP